MTLSEGKPKYIAMLCFGLLMLAATTWVAYEYRGFESDAETTSGIVVDIENKKGNRGQNIQYAIVEFTDNSGTKQTFKSPLESALSPYASGDKVTVIYDTANPSEAHIDSFWITWFLIIFMMLFGYALIAGGYRGISALKDLKSPGD